MDRPDLLLTISTIPARSRSGTKAEAGAVGGATPGPGLEPVPGAAGVVRLNAGWAERPA
jgi:hypothetical protein